MYFVHIIRIFHVEKHTTSQFYQNSLRLIIIICCYCIVCHCIYMRFQRKDLTSSIFEEKPVSICNFNIMVIEVKSFDVFTFNIGLYVEEVEHDG